MFWNRAFERQVIFTILLTAAIFVFIGCEKIMTEDIMRNDDLGFVDTPWEIASVNGESLDTIFAPVPEEGIPPSATTVTSNFVFGATGKFNGELKFTLSENIPDDPPRSLTFVVTYTVTGNYTAKETTLTIETQNVVTDVTAKLTPREVWEKELEGITFEQLQADLASESEMGYEQDESAFPFIVGANYTHQTEQDTLTLSVPGNTMVLKKKME